MALLAEDPWVVVYPGQALSELTYGGKALHITHVVLSLVCPGPHTAGDEHAVACVVHNGGGTYTGNLKLVVQQVGGGNAHGRMTEHKKELYLPAKDRRFWISC